MDPLSTLQRLGRGMFMDKLALTLAEVASEVADERRPGKVTITFDLKPSPEDRAVVIMEKIKRSPPADGERGAYFYAFEGELWTADPRQPGLPEFRTVDTTSGEVRETDAGTTVREA